MASKATPEGTLGYTYDAAGNAVSVLSSNTNGTNVSYGYDANERLSGVTDNGPGGGATSYGYDQTNQLSSMQYPDSVAHSYGYDNRDRLINLNLTGPGGALASYTQVFSPSGRKQSATEGTGRAANYAYDSIYRLLTESISGDPTAADNGSLNYTLDPVGNRSSLASTLAALQAQTFTYNVDDRISGDTFDANGNTLHQWWRELHLRLRRSA